MNIKSNPLDGSIIGVNMYVTKNMNMEHKKDKQNKCTVDTKQILYEHLSQEHKKDKLHNEHK